MDLAGAGADNTIIFAGGSYVSAPLSDVQLPISDLRRGGTGVLAAVDIYNTVSDTWTVANLSLGRSVLCGAGLGTKIVFAGGGYGILAILPLIVRRRVVAVNNVDVYDTQLTKWTTSSLSVARYALSCAGAGTKIVFAGGLCVSKSPIGLLTTMISDGTTAFQNADIYDITSNLWTAQPNALSVGRYVGAAAAAGNKIVFAGGMYDVQLPYGALTSLGMLLACHSLLSIFMTSQLAYGPLRSTSSA